jgi:hypothetical protein
VVAGRNLIAKRNRIMGSALMYRVTFLTAGEVQAKTCPFQEMRLMQSGVLLVGTLTSPWVAAKLGYPHKTKILLALLIAIRALSSHLKIASLSILLLHTLTSDYTATVAKLTPYLYCINAT